MKLTPWFNADKKPIRRGVYETDAIPGSFQFWTGKFWGLQGDRTDFWPVMAGNVKEKSLYQNVKWRGLAKDPNA